MGEIITVERKIFGKSTFSNTIDVDFKELVPPTTQAEEENTPTVEKFFSDYNTLFYDIPVSGSENSHETLFLRSGEAIGINVADMDEEIRQLREENVSLKRQLFILSNS